jgi:hypothetical protein
MSKQTAVQWLEERDNVLTMKFLEKKITQREFVVQKSKLIEQVKQMERLQIEETYNQACLDAFRDDNKYGSDYYNETYGETKK